MDSKESAYYCQLLHLISSQALAPGYLGAVLASQRHLFTE